MNRLTARTTNGHAYHPECFKPPCNGDGCKKELCEFSVEICSRLADYEDTGLTPEQIRKIDELYAEKCRELAEERKKHEWIPVEERLPEEHENILGTFMYKDIMPVMMLKENSDDVIVTVEFENGATISTKGYTVGGEWKTDMNGKDKVIAWMPLPSPYNQEETE